jgi:uroporphyrinogen-III synthase
MSARVLLNTRPQLEGGEGSEGAASDTLRAGALAVPEQLPGGPYAQVIDCPLNGIQPATPTELDEAAALINRAHVLVLVSPNATQVYAQLAAAGRISRAPAHIAVMGPASSARLQLAGADRNAQSSRLLVSASNDALGLLPELLRLAADGESIVIGRAQTGKDALPDALRARGRSVHCVVLYHRDALAWPAALRTQIEAAVQSRQAAVLFTTASAPAEFVQRLSAEARAVLPATAALCTHPNVLRAAQAQGFAEAVLL